MDEIPEEIRNARIRFWTCVVRSHKHVEWRGDVAHCIEPGCEVTSEDTENLVQIFREVMLCPLGQEVRRWKPEDGDRRCQRCGVPNTVWFVDNALWNRVMPNDGIVCIPCFIRMAEALGLNKTAWHLTQEQPVDGSGMEGGLIEWEPGRWWRAISPETGATWVESSDEEEVRRMARPTDKIQNLYQSVRLTEWRDA